MISAMEKTSIDIKYKEKFGEYPPTFQMTEQQMKFVYEEAQKAVDGKRGAIEYGEAIEQSGVYHKEADY